MGICTRVRNIDCAVWCTVLLECAWCLMQLMHSCVMTVLETLRYRTRVTSHSEIQYAK